MNENMSIILIIFLFQVIPGENRFEKYMNDANSVRCLLLKKHQDPCVILGGNQVPQHLVQVLQNLPEEVRHAIRSNEAIWNFAAEDYKFIPRNYWLLMPVERLSKLSGPNLSSILLANPKETSIAAHIMIALQTTEQRNSFLVSISDKKVFSDEVENIIAEAVSTWKIDKDWNNIRAVIVGSPLLAHFPPYFLFTASQSIITKFLFFIHAWDVIGNPDWLKKPMLIQRVWAHLFFEHYHLQLTNWQYMHMRKFQYLLPGMTPDELGDLRKMKNISAVINRQTLFNIMNFDMQQSQLLFDVLYKDKILNKRSFMELSNLLTKLSPLQLQKFPINTTNFMATMSDIFHDKNDFITLKQITQMIIAEFKLVGKLRSVHSSDWGPMVKNLGVCVYTLSLHEIRQLSRKPLDPFVLEAIESSKLSFAQIYYLTQNGTSLQADKPTTTRSLKWMLQGLPASNISPLSMNKMSSSIWLTLLSNLPSDNIPRSFAFLNHIIHSIYDTDESIVLERLFRNPTMEGYFKIIPSHILKNITKKISNNFNVLKNRYRNKLVNLPNNVLTLLLNENRYKSWIWNNTVNVTISLKFFIRGLTCFDVEKLETSEFIYVISQFNKENKEAGQVFPKNLQLCCLEKLIKYLEMKSRIMQEEQNKGLIELLEPGEIEALGGYILAGLPTPVISASRHRKQILTTIGKLSMPELMLAISKQKMYELVQLALAVFKRGNELGNTEFLQMRNLILFLPSDSLVDVKPSTVKLIVQLNFTDRRLCTDKKTREIWSNIIIKAFGEVQTWTEGVITSLDDFLLVIDDEMLNKINKSIWLKVAEPLKFHYGDMIEWWKDHVPFHEACTANILENSEINVYTKEIEKLIRWQLKLAQWKLNTVRTADEFLSEFERPGLRNRNIPVNILSHFINKNNGKLPSAEEERIKCNGICDLDTKTNNSKILIHDQSTNVPYDITSHYNYISSNDEFSEIIPTTESSNNKTLVTQYSDEVSQSSSSYYIPTSGEFSTTVPNSSPENVFSTSSTSEKIYELNDKISSTTESFDNYDMFDKTESQTLTTFDFPSTTNRPSTMKNNVKPPQKSFWNIFFPSLLDEDAGTKTSSSAIGFDTSTEEYSQTTHGEFFTTTISGVLDDSNDHSSPSYIITTAGTNDSNEVTNSDFHISSTSESSGKYEAITTELFDSPSITTNSNINEETSSYIFLETSDKSEKNNNLNYESETTTPFSLTTDVYEEDQLFTHSMFDSDKYDDADSKYITESSSINANTSEMYNDVENYSSSSDFPSISSVAPLDLEEMPSNTETYSSTSFDDGSINLSSTSNFENKYDDYENDSNSTATSMLPNESSFTSTTDYSDYYEEKPSFETSNDTLEDVNERSHVEEFMSKLLSNIIPVDSENYDSYNLFERDSNNDDYYYDPVYGRITKRNTHSYFRENFDQDSITCDALKAVGGNLHLIFDERHISMMNNDEINDCFEVFGKMNLLNGVEKIWEKIANKELHLMGSLLKAVAVNDIDRLTFNFNEPWFLETLYLISKFTSNADVVQKTIEKVIETNKIEEIGPDSLASLNHLICKMNRDTRKKILSTTNDNSLAISVLANINYCSPECLEDLAEFAMDDKNYGYPDKWDLYDVMSLGVIPAGLKNNEWRKLITNGHYAIMGLQPSAIKCLSLENLKAISPELFRLMPFKTVMAIYREKYSLLWARQQNAVTQILSININITESLLPTVKQQENIQDISLSCRSNQSVLTVLIVAICIYKFI